jgi:hypothetical protein
MALNRYEQLIYDHIQSHPEELRHWENKVLVRARHGNPDATGLADELWEYMRERADHVPGWRAWAGGIPRSSLRNLAEYLLRLWGPLPAAKRNAAAKGGQTG